MLTNLRDRFLINSQRVVLDGFFRVVEAEVSHERLDGTMSGAVRWLSLERGDSVAVVVLDVELGAVLLTRQFRWPTRSFLLELVAGGVGRDEDPELAAMRELDEEIGHRVSSLTPVTSFYTSPGGSSERIHVFYAEVDSSTRSGPGGGLPEEHEDIEVVAIPVIEVFNMLDRGLFWDAKTIIGLNWLATRVGRA